MIINSYKYLSLLALITWCFLGAQQPQTLWEQLSSYRPPEEKPIVIVIPSYNNKPWYKKNLDSVFCQNYNNYRIIYINDVSTDGTGELVAQYVQAKGQAHRVTVINNKTRIGGGGNIYKAVQISPDNAIIAELDGDDWFDNPNVLSLLNKVYTKEGVWMTYGQYQIMPDDRLGECEPIPANIIAANAYRSYKWVSSHLRTWYAWLFKKINYADMRYKDGFFPMAWDQAFMLPMLEMAAERVYFIPDITYRYNLGNAINDYKVNSWQQGYLNAFIRRKKRYERLPDSCAPTI